MSDITRGLMDRKRPLIINVMKRRWSDVVDHNPEVIDEGVLKFARSMAKATDLPLEKVLKSSPVRSYRNKVWFREKTFKNP